MSKKTTKPSPFLKSTQERIETLESIVNEKLQLFDKVSLYTSKTPPIYTGRGLDQRELAQLYSYFDWVRNQIHYYDHQNSTERKAIPNYSPGEKRARSKKIQKFYKGNSDSRDTLGLKNINLCNPDSLLLSPPNCFGSIKVGNYDLSFCLQLVVEVYCNKLDTDQFWLSRERVEKVIRSPDNSLLKYIIIDSALKVSSLTKEEKKCISFLNQDLSSLIVSSYSSPSLNDVIALALLATEEFLKYDLVRAKTYLSKAFRLADLFYVNPDFRENNSNFPQTFDDCYKDKLWEILLLVHGYIFFESHGPPLGNCSTVCNFSHVGSKELCFPTVSRVLKIPKSELIQLPQLVKELKSFSDDPNLSELNFNNTLRKRQRRSIPETNLRIYTEAHQIFLMLYQYSLKAQHQYFKNPQELDMTHFFLPDLERMSYTSKLTSILETLPTHLKIPQISTIHFIWNDSTTNPSQNQDSSTLGNLAYIALLSCLINVHYPFIWFHPQPCPLPDPDSWRLVLKCSNAIFRFFISLSSLLRNTKHTDYIVFNICDSLSAIYTYLNAILNGPSMSHQFKQVLFSRAQTIVDQIKLLTEQDHLIMQITAKTNLETLRDALKSFYMPEEFRLKL